MFFGQGVILKGLTLQNLVFDVCGCMLCLTLVQGLVINFIARAFCNTSATLIHLWYPQDNVTFLFIFLAACAVFVLCEVSAVPSAVNNYFYCTCGIVGQKLDSSGGWVGWGGGGVHWGLMPAVGSI